MNIFHSKIKKWIAKLNILFSILKIEYFLVKNKKVDHKIECSSFKNKKVDRKIEYYSFNFNNYIFFIQK